MKKKKKLVSDWLQVNGFTSLNTNIWEKVGTRIRITVTLKKTVISVCVREIPLKEGWFIKDYLHTDFHSIPVCIT